MKLDSRSRGRRFDSRSNRYQVLSIWTGKPTVFYPFGVGKSSTDLSGSCYDETRSLVQVADLCDLICQVTLQALRLFFYEKLYYFHLACYVVTLLMTSLGVRVVLYVGGHGEKARTRSSEGEEGDGTSQRSVRVKRTVAQETSSGTAERSLRPTGTRQQTEV